MKREQLFDLGLSEELVNEVFKLHGTTINAMKEKQDAAISELQLQLDAANETIANASKSTEDLEGIQAKLAEYQTKYEEVESTLAQERKTMKIKEALTEAKGKDLEYLMYKLGDIEDLEGLPAAVASLKEQLPQHFLDETTQGQNKMEVIGVPLEKGTSNKTYSLEEIANLSTEEINDNWSIISQSLNSN